MTNSTLTVEQEKLVNEILKRENPQNRVDEIVHKTKQSITSNKDNK